MFDVDGTLCNYIHGLASGLQKIQSVGEATVELPIKADAPAHVWQCVQMITGSPDWWANLPRFELGFDVWKIAEELQYRRMILTQGPKRNPFAWSGKKMWIDEHHPGSFVPPVPCASKIAYLLGPDGAEIEIGNSEAQR